MRKIIYYEKNGIFCKEESLSLESLKNAIGKMSKCCMKNGTVIIGFADPYRVYKNSPLPFDEKVHDFIYLWKWENLDEKTHQLIGDDIHKYDQIFQRVEIQDIETMECILHSNPRWGTELTNKFDYFKSDNV